MLNQEERFGLRSLKGYGSFSHKVKQTKRELLSFLIAAKAKGKRICGYGAPGKGNTLLNYCGIGTDFLDFTVDRNPYNMALLAGHALPDWPIRDNRCDLPR